MSQTVQTVPVSALQATFFIEIISHPLAELSKSRDELLHNIGHYLDIIYVCVIVFSDVLGAQLSDEPRDSIFVR